MYRRIGGEKGEEENKIRNGNRNLGLGREEKNIVTLSLREFPLIGHLSSASLRVQINIERSQKLIARAILPGYPP